MTVPLTSEYPDYDLLDFFFAAFLLVIRLVAFFFTAFFLDTLFRVLVLVPGAGTVKYSLE